MRKVKLLRAHEGIRLSCFVEMVKVSMEALPLGFRFRPTDEELIDHYLRLKILGRDAAVQVIPEVDVCKWEPWDLPGLSVIKSDDPEWFFFCPRDRKYPNGHRSNRATDAGYWKATGKDRTIKSRRSGSISLIGMKKTLVFYRGRAPKGERTNWIMHEYRNIEKDSDATDSAQGDYVLFRLFRKPEEKTGVQKYDEVEQTVLSPTKSSPDETSSDLVQEPATSDTQVAEDIEGIKRWKTDKSEDLTPDAFLSVESCCNSYKASDIEDHPSMTSFPLGEGSRFSEPTGSQIDCKVFSPLQSQIHTELGPYMYSPFGDDFGNDHNEYQFQDGTTEQDVSLTDLLDEFFNNHGECSGEEATSQKNLAVQHDSEMGGASWLNENVGMDTLQMDMSVYGSESTNREIPDNYGNDFVSKTRITTRTRHPENQSTSTLRQGIAPRRIRLQTELSPVSVSSDNFRETSCTEEDGLVQSTVTDAKEGTQQIPTNDNPEKGRNLREDGMERVINGEFDTKLRLRVKQDKEMTSCQMASLVSVKAGHAHSGSRFFSVMRVGVPLVLAMCMSFIVVWRYS